MVFRATLEHTTNECTPHSTFNSSHVQLVNPLIKRLLTYQKKLAFSIPVNNETISADQFYRSLENCPVGSKKDCISNASIARVS